MPQVQNGRYNLSVFIDNLDILSSGCLLGKCSLFESIYSHIPSCEMNVVVPAKMMDQRSIVDGSKIRFEIEFCFEKNRPKEAYTYRIYDIKKLSLKDQYIELEISALLDFYDGYTAANKYNATGNTSDIFNSIVAANNLEASIDGTNDKQLWIAGQKNVFNFMQMLSERGWIDNTSCMYWTFDRSKRLLYKNLTALIANRSDKIYTFKQNSHSENEKLTYGYTSCVSNIPSGKENIYSYGYGGNSYHFDLLDYEQKQVNAKSAVAWSNLFNINKEVSKGLFDVFSPFDVGNFHPNYEKAKIQNLRLLSTYSSYTVLESQYFQPYRLGQIVNLEYIDANNPESKINCLSGIRVISSIRIDLSQSFIRSKVELLMQGLNGRSIVQEVY